MAAKGKTKKGTKKPLRRAKKPTREERVEVSGGDEDPTILPLLTGNMPPIRDIMYHLDTINGLQDKARAAAGKVSEAKKKAKEAGVDLKALSEGMGLDRMDPLEMASYFRQLQTIMREKGLPVQLTLYEPKYGSIEEQAKAEGWAAGMSGRSPDTERWPEGAPGHVDYMRRWNDAQAQIISDGAKPHEEA